MTCYYIPHRNQLGFPRCFATAQKSPESSGNTSSDESLSADVLGVAATAITSESLFASRLNVRSARVVTNA